APRGAETPSQGRDPQALRQRRLAARAGAHGPPLLQQRPRARLMRTETFETPGPVRLDVEMPAGEIEIATATTDEPHVELETLWSKEQPKEWVASRGIESIRRGDFFHVTVEVRTRHGVWISFRGGPDIQLGTPQMRLRISCPAGAELDVKTKSADLQAHGEYGDVDFKTASGDLSIETARNAHVQTASRDIHFATVGGVLDVTGVSGA